MNETKIVHFAKGTALCLVLALLVIACGVKGPPLPPDEPPVLGHGQPTFHKATEQMRLPKKLEDDFEEPEDFDDKEK